ncbi:MAG: 3-carboxy-cis,cis-muconate cycloisomerase, partial [Gammaproteobacteria bacterium]
SEVGEVAEPSAPNRGASSTLPHKHNPVGCTVALAAAMRAPGLMANLYAALPQEHERAVGGWHAEWEVLPDLCRLAAGSLHHMVVIVDDLAIDAALMQAHVTAVPGILFSEAVANALATKLGKTEAHNLVANLSLEALRTGQHLRALIIAEYSLRPHFRAAELEQMFDVEHALGASDALIDQVLARV